jgi:hypothetical protein
VKATAKELPVMFAGFDKGGKTFELDTTNRSLRIKWLEIKAEVGINVFVIVAFRELAELPLEALIAGVIFT